MVKMTVMLYAYLKNTFKSSSKLNYKYIWYFKGFYHKF